MCFLFLFIALVTRFGRNHWPVPPGAMMGEPNAVFFPPPAGAKRRKRKGVDSAPEHVDEPLPGPPDLSSVLETTRDVIREIALATAPAAVLQPTSSTPEENDSIGSIHSANFIPPPLERQDSVDLFYPALDRHYTVENLHEWLEAQSRITFT